MREILEDAAVVYRHEAESLLIVAAPAVVIGPVCVLIASAGLPAALVCVPIMLVVYLLTYGASLMAAHLVYDSQEPDPGRAFLGAIARFPALLVAFAPAGGMMIAAAVAALIVADAGWTFVAFAIGVLAAFVALSWIARHVYDPPLVVAYGLSGLQALRAGRSVQDGAPGWTARVYVATGLPLIGAWLLCWAFWMVLSPAFGAAVFAALTAVWMPFAALTMVAACSRLVAGEELETEDPAGQEEEPTAYAQS